MAMAVVLKISCHAANEASVVDEMALSGTTRESNTNKRVTPSVGSGPAPIVYDAFSRNLIFYVLPAELTISRKTTTMLIKSPTVGCCIF